MLNNIEMKIKEIKQEIKKYKGVHNITNKNKKELLETLNNLKIKYQGEGLIDIFRGVQADYNNASKNTLKQYGSLKIKQIQIIRTPILSFLNKVLNVITLGKWDRAKQQANYNKLYHLTMLCICENNTKVYIEKNEKVNIITNFKIQNNAELTPIININDDISINQLLDNTINAIGKNKFFKYDAFYSNCQMFLIDILKTNNILNNDLEMFIFQPLDNLIKNLPSATHKITKFITDAGAKVSEIFGFGKYSYNDDYNLIKFL